MFHLLFTILSDIVMSLRVTRGLEIMSLITVCMLLGSPGVIATLLGISTKLGILSYALNEDKDSQTSG